MTAPPPHESPPPDSRPTRPPAPSPVAHTTLPSLPVRDPRGHKGTFGTVAVVAGCCEGHHRMIGAGALAGTGALRAGCGLLKLVMPEPILAAGITLCPSATGLALPVDDHGTIVPHEAVPIFDEAVAGCGCLAIGPGLGSGDNVRGLVLRAVQQEQTPIVADADAINALAEIPELWRDFRAAAILTPHPGEFRRLAASLKIELDPVDPGSRPLAAAALAQRLGCVVVLKGAGTVVSDGQRSWTCEIDNAALATAGTGDVLTGVIAGLVAQFVAPPEPPRPAPMPPRPIPAGKPLDLFEAACLGVRTHALAAQRWVEAHEASAGLLAEELCGVIPGVMGSLRRASAM
jgi:ADP-dependent NAD(P)H-hydrate dehydratase